MVKGKKKLYFDLIFFKIKKKLITDPQQNCGSHPIILQIPPIILGDKGSDMAEPNTTNPT